MGVSYRINGSVPERTARDRPFTSLYDDAAPVTITVGAYEDTRELNVRLFLHELGFFLEECFSQQRAVWRVDFEPFRFGFRRPGKLELTLDAGGRSVVAVLSYSELDALRRKVSRDIQKFGSITNPTSEQPR